MNIITKINNSHLRLIKEVTTNALKGAGSNYEEVECESSQITSPEKPGLTDQYMQGDEKSVTCQPMAIKQPKPVFFRTGKDIQDRNEKLQGLLAKYQELLDQLPIISFVSSLENPGKLLYLSPKVEQLGFSQEEWLTNLQGFFNQIHIDDRDSTIALYRKAQTEKKFFSCEFRLERKDGRTVHVQNQVCIIHNQHGKALFLQGLLTDITETQQAKIDLSYYRTRLEFMVAQRTEQLEKQCAILKSANINLVNTLSDQRRVEIALRNSEKNLRMLLESAGEGIFGLDMEGLCTFANQAALDMLGYTQEEILHQDLYNLIRMNNEADSASPPEKWDVYYASINDISLRNTQIFKHKNETPIRVEYSSYPIHLDNELGGAVLIFRDVTESLCYQATHDPLTGLINRTEFWQRMNRALVNAHNHQAEHVLCYLDLDHFKKINDTCGHAAGDQLLCKLSSLLQSKLRKRDSLARMGGDEFALLLEHCSFERGCQLASELCDAIRNYPFVWENQTYKLGISIGLTTMTRMDDDIGSVLKKADAACYLAKEEGRGRFQVFQIPLKSCYFKETNCINSSQQA